MRLKNDYSLRITSQKCNKYRLGVVYIVVVVVVIVVVDVVVVVLSEDNIGQDI